MKDLARAIYHFLFKQAPVYYFNPKLKSLTWVITGGCNLDCVFCEAGQLLNNKTDVPLKRCFEIIDEARNLGVKAVHLTGGEPFLRRDFFDILNYLHQKNIYIGITTNGTVFSKMPDSKMGIIRRTVGNMLISLDSADKERFDHIRGRKGTFDLVLDGIKRLSLSPHINVTITAVITRENYEDILPLIDLSKGMGIKNINFQPVSPTARFKTDIIKEKNKLMLTEHCELENLDKIVQEGAKKIKEFNIKSNLEFLRLYLKEYFNSFNETYNGFYLNNILKEHFKCIVPFNSISIRHDGNVQCCTMLHSIGNINNSSLKELWEKARGIRRRLKKNNFFPVCNNCFCQVSESLKFSIINSIPYNFRYLKYVL